MNHDDYFNTIQEARNNLPLWRRVRAYLRADHFIFGKVTLMDITICTAVFLIVGFTLSYRTSLQPIVVVLLLVLLCSGIMHFRIRYRPYKKAAYLLARVQKCMKQLKKSEEMETNPIIKARIQDTIKQLEAYMTTLGNTSTTYRTNK